MENSIRIKRPVISCTFEVPDQTIVTEPGQAQSVQKLYQDFVLGRLDPRDIGNVSYDSAEGVITEDIDPFNSFGMTLEQADALRQRSEETIRSEKGKRKTVANAPTDTKQDEPHDQKPGSEPGSDQPQS